MVGLGPIAAVRRGLSEAGRAAASWAPILGAVPPPNRAQGLSAIVRVKDEETWLDASIRSIATVADEIVIGDNGSTDRTPEILRQLERELSDRVTVMRRPDLDIKDLTNLLIGRTRFRWVIRWDADFVARTDGARSIQRLREWLLSLDTRRHTFVYATMIELFGDLFHQRPDTALRDDCHCLTYSDILRYVYDRVGYEAPKVPVWYRVLRYETPTFFHVDVKPSRRMFLSFLWTRYLGDPERARFASFEDYVKAELATRWDGQNIDDVVAAWIPSVFQELVPYDRRRFGDYPALLQPFLEQPKFQILYVNGRIVGRREP
jgi:glycosyltransferase involved in cell wall biosynthesis